MSSTIDSYIKTPIDDIPKIVAKCRTAYNNKVMKTVEQRKDALRRMINLIKENLDLLKSAVHKDLGKPSMEFEILEAGVAMSDAWEAVSRLDDWVKPEYVEKDFALKMEDVHIKRDPLGTVLIIGAWNFPLQLLFVPMVGALAAGNTVVLKPSEISPHSAAAMSALLPRYFPNNEVVAVNGAVAETTALLNERFDHIMYTGNSRVARIVMAAAAKHLTPVTLELGGKSPCIVDSNCDLRIAARRIAWGRLVNSGQTCIAPDYLLVNPSIKEKFVAELKKALTEFLGEDAQKSKSYSRIVNNMHFKRVKALMSGGKVVVGGKTDEADRFIEPTVLDNVDLTSPLMTDEIFGPLLPMIPCASAAEAIDFINKREKPLALYIFSNDSKFASEIVDNTSSGGVTVNDCLMHAAVPTLPFGGVGESGMGAYHGKLSFDIFSHKKAVMKRKQALEALNKMRYPPYNETNKNRMLMLLFRTGPENPMKKRLLQLIVVAAAAIGVRYLLQRLQFI